jgi:prophage antirepressor-like protein
MSENNRIYAHFEDRVHVLDIGGRAVVVARELGDLLGYGSQGAQLVTMLTDKWSDELIPDTDVITLRGGSLAALKRACRELGLDLVDKRAAALTLLTMSGIQLVLSRSEKPEAKAFRRWLVSEVIPSYERMRLGGPNEEPAGALGAQTSNSRVIALGGPAAPLDARPRRRRRPVGGAEGDGGEQGGEPPVGPPGAAPELAGAPQQPIPVMRFETVEEKLAAAHAAGQELPRPASPAELVRGQILRLVRSSLSRAALLVPLRAAAGEPPPVSGAVEQWEVDVTQAVWMVRTLDPGQLVVARAQVGDIALAAAPHDPKAAAVLLVLLQRELQTLPEGVLMEVLAAVPRWRSGIERPIPLPVGG